MDLALYEPEIPPNTGNIIRLCANTGVGLHLIHPLGFDLSDKQLRRAGLDYHEFASLQEHENLDAFRAAIGQRRLLALSTRGVTSYSDAKFQEDDVLIFGPETRGLPTSLLQALPEAQRLHIPMRPNSRSLNLSNAAALVVYEAWRQQDFSGASP